MVTHDPAEYVDVDLNVSEELFAALAIDGQRAGRTVAGQIAYEIEERVAARPHPPIDVTPPKTGALIPWPVVPHGRPQATKGPVLTVGAFLVDFIRLHLRGLKSSHEVERVCALYFGPFLDRPLDAVTRLDVRRWFVEIGATKPAAANRAKHYLRLLFNKAAEWGVYEGPNPCQGVKRYRRPSRARFVQPGAEMTRLMQSLAQEPAIIRTYFLLVILTGARRTEAATARWTDLNLEVGLWLKPTTKNGLSHQVPLPEALVALLRALPRDSPYVFPTRTGKPWQCGTLCFFWFRIRARAGLDDVRIHDLRRTTASWLAISGANLPVISSVLNHQDLQSTSIYARLNTAPVKLALEANAAAMLGHDHGAPPAPIAPPTQDSAPSSSSPDAPKSDRAPTNWGDW